ncbi:hypothetical protein [Aquimonas voraii]|nr:hypothetical protein [Aquimonas voraii]
MATAVWFSYQVSITDRNTVIFPGNESGDNLLTPRSFGFIVFASIVLAGFIRTPLTEYWDSHRRSADSHDKMAKLVDWSKTESGYDWELVEYQLLRGDIDRYLGILKCSVDAPVTQIETTCSGTQRDLDRIIRTLRARVAETDAKEELALNARYVESGFHWLAFLILLIVLGLLCLAGMVVKDVVARSRAQKGANDGQR